MDRFLNTLRSIWNALREQGEALPPAGPTMQSELLGLLRLILIVFSVLLVTALGNIFFEPNLNAQEIAQGWKGGNPFFGWVPDRIMVFFAYFINGRSVRYMIAPITAFLYIFVAGSRYVQDVYEIKRFRQAMHYVVSSLFSIFYPTMNVDAGKLQIAPDEINLLERIGGPGYVTIQPGNAVLVEGVRDPLRVLRQGIHFLNRFEYVGYLANLEDQHTTQEELRTMTLDGFQVVVRNIRSRYRVLPGAQRMPRTLETPFPFEDASLMNIAYTLTVDPGGLDSWNIAVRRIVSGEITDFINKNKLDYLTAPLDSGLDPIQEIRERLLSRAVYDKLSRLGTELLWVDVGHIDILEPNVDDSRVGLWKARWSGDSSIVRAYGEAKRQAYEELGRAEGQAEMIMSIASALQENGLAGSATDRMSELVLARTAQILDAMNNQGIAAKKKPNEKPT